MSLRTLVMVPNKTFESRYHKIRFEMLLFSNQKYTKLDTLAVTNTFNDLFVTKTVLTCSYQTTFFLRSNFLVLFHLFTVTLPVKKLTFNKTKSDSIKSFSFRI